MFESVQFVEEETQGRLNDTPTEKVIGTYDSIEEAVEAGRAARRHYRNSDNRLYAWWIARRAGADVAAWIADSRSDKEFVLDIRTNRLEELRR